MDTISLISEAYTKKEYRPVVAAIIRNTKGQILVVQSAKNLHEWYLPQGGIDENETLESALFRELYEELGVVRNDLVFMGYLGFEDLDAEETREDKRGFTRGKRYFFCIAAHKGKNEEMRLNTQEVCGYLWANIADFTYIFTQSRMEKRDLMLRWLKKLL